MGRLWAVIFHAFTKNGRFFKKTTLPFGNFPLLTVVLNMNIGKTLYRTALSGCISFVAASSVLGEPYSLLELPPQRSIKETFEKYSQPLGEVDKERLQKLRELGYNETFRVVSFNGLGKSGKDFEERIKNYETVLKDCVKAIPCSFCFCNTESKVYDFPLCR